MLIITSQSHEFHNLLSRFLRQSLPETRHHSGDERRRERRSVIIDDISTARNHTGRTSVSHHVRFDSAVSSRSHGTESRILAHFVYAAHGKDIACIGREIDFLPVSHSVVSCRIDTDDSLVSTHRSGTGDEGRITILLIIMMVGRRIIEAMIA